MVAYSGDYTSANRLMLDLMTRPGPVEHFNQWAHVYLVWSLAMSGRVAQAEAELAILLGGRPVEDFELEIALAGGQLIFVKLLAGDLGAARRVAHRVEALASEALLVLIAPGLQARGMLALAAGDSDAIDLLERAAVLAERIGGLFVPSFLVPLAEGHLAVGDLATALATVDRALLLGTRNDTPGHVAACLVTKARVLWAVGDKADAEDTAHEALSSARGMDLPAATIDVLELLGVILVDGGRCEEGARLLGAGAVARQALGYLLRLPRHQAGHDAAIAAARSHLGDEPFERAWAEGESMELAEACDYSGRGRGERRRPTAGWGSLTPTEQKVVALVTEGLTNPQVGERLFISRHTVDTHLRHIFAKLGVSTRAELAGKAAERAQAGDGADA
jgi:DNA-binding CsgD family transcriptional regulator